MGLGNIRGALLVALFVKEFTTAPSLSAILLTSVTLLAITFYFSTFADGVVAGLFLFIAALVRQVSNVLPFVFAFVVVDRPLPLQVKLSRYALGIGVGYLAQVASTAMMLAYTTTGSTNYQFTVAAVLFILVLCLVALMFNAQHSRAHRTRKLGRRPHANARTHAGQCHAPAGGGRPGRAGKRNERPRRCRRTRNPA